MNFVNYSLSDQGNKMISLKTLGKIRQQHKGSEAWERRETRRAYHHTRWLCVLEKIAKIREKNSLLEEFPGCPETCGELQGSTAVQFQRGSSSSWKSTRQGNKYLVLKYFLRCFMKDGIALLSKYLVIRGA